MLRNYSQSNKDKDKLKTVTSKYTIPRTFSNMQPKINAQKLSLSIQPSQLMVARSESIEQLQTILLKSRQQGLAEQLKRIHKKSRIDINQLVSCYDSILRIASQFQHPQMLICLAKSIKATLNSSPSKPVLQEISHNQSRIVQANKRYYMYRSNKSTSYIKGKDYEKHENQHKNKNKMQKLLQEAYCAAEKYDKNQESQCQQKHRQSAEQKELKFQSNISMEKIEKIRFKQREKSYSNKKWNKALKQPEKSEQQKIFRHKVSHSSKQNILPGTSNLQIFKGFRKKSFRKIIKKTNFKPAPKPQIQRNQLLGVNIPPEAQLQLESKINSGSMVSSSKETALVETYLHQLVVVLTEQQDMPWSSDYPKASYDQENPNEVSCQANNNETYLEKTLHQISHETDSQIESYLQQLAKNASQYSSRGQSNLKTQSQQALSSYFTLDALGSFTIQGSKKKNTFGAQNQVQLQATTQPISQVCILSGLLSALTVPKLQLAGEESTQVRKQNCQQVKSWAVEFNNGQFSLWQNFAVNKESYQCCGEEYHDYKICRDSQVIAEFGKINTRRCKAIQEGLALIVACTVKLEYNQLVPVADPTLLQLVLDSL